MLKKLLLVTLFAVLIFGCKQSNLPSNETLNLTPEDSTGNLAPGYEQINQKYIWREELHFCNFCWNGPDLIAEEELMQVAKDFEKELKGEVVFDGYAEYYGDKLGFYLNTTDLGKESIEDILFRKKNFSTGLLTFTTIYHKQIFPSIQKRPIRPEDIYYCISDAECASEPKGCCPCSSRGTAISINRIYHQYYEENRSCGGIGCFAMLSKDPTCLAKPKCINNSCSVDY